MSILIVANDPKAWPFQIPDVDVVDARSYLTKPEYSDMRGVKVFNLCKSYRYQSAGYYVSLLAEASIPLPDEHEDRGVYVMEGAVEIAGDRFEAGRMMVFRPGDRVALRAGEKGARLMLLGGETLGTRYIWWNYVASSIENARRPAIGRAHRGATFTLISTVRLAQPSTARAACAFGMPTNARGSARSRHSPRCLVPMPGSTITSGAPTLNSANTIAKRSSESGTISTVRTPGPIPTSRRPRARRSLSSSSWR